MPSINRMAVWGLTLGTLVFAGSAWAEKPVSQEDIRSMTQKAANGDLAAQAELARRYYKAEGVEQDLAKAARWYQKLAETGVAEAQLTLGLLFIKGDGVKKDDIKAVHLLTQAAEQRMPAAQYLLGLAYADGHGVKKDLIKAYMWYEVASAMEYADASSAQQELAKNLSQAEIAQAEQMATEWWMRFHH